eukprot:196196_1
MGNKSSKKQIFKETHFKRGSGALYEKLRNEWKIGSKCIVFSKRFKKWINTNIEEIEIINGEQILTVKNYGDKVPHKHSTLPSSYMYKLPHHDTISLERFG